MTLIKFDTEQISAIASATLAHQGEWDAIWQDVKTKLSGVVSDALDAATGMSLEERSARYSQKTSMYTQQLMSRAAATSQVASIAEQTNIAMVKTLTG